MIVKDEEVLRQAEEIDDAKGNLEMIKRIPLENYRSMYLVSCFDDNKTVVLSMIYMKMKKHYLLLFVEVKY